MGGYGGAPYGLGPYGSGDTTSPSVVSVVSLDGFRFEVSFSEEMDIGNPALLDPVSYTLTPVVGGPSSVVSLEVGTPGVLSVIIHHAGTTLGGTYSLVVTGPTDLSGNPVNTAPTSFFTLGEMPALTITPISGTQVLLDWAFDMLSPAGGSTIDQLSAYDLSHPPYPIPSTLTGVTFPYMGDSSQVVLTIDKQTNHLYTLVIDPGMAIPYDGSILPSASTNFNGVIVNALNGSSAITGEPALSLSRTTGTTYGWEFEDTSGNFAPATNFRVDFEFDASAATYLPALGTLVAPVVGTLTIEDSVPAAGVQIKVALQRNLLGNDELRLYSGGYDVTFAADWSIGGRHTISVLRNLKAGIYTLLFDGAVVTSTAIANFTAPASEIGTPGVSWVFAPLATTISGFRVYTVEVVASSTVFSAAWNFLVNYSTLFTGSSLLAQKYLLTRRGPLTKDWGDATPATTEDVAVTVNGVPVLLADVNPYIGRVEMAIAVPTSVPPPTVLVDYFWIASPPMLFAGLNTEGLVLNKWDMPRGHHDPAWHRDTPANYPLGALDTQRFQMGVVLGPDTFHNPQPLYIGHRYIGFEKEYSALLNSPTTLLLNQNPHAPSIPGFEEATQSSAVAYEATTTPLDASPSWSLNGYDTGSVDTVEGLYTLVDSRTNPFDPNTPSATVYWQKAGLAFPAAINLVARMKALNDSTLTLDGVFTGVGFGVHDNARMYFLGLLSISGSQHVGLLLDPIHPGIISSWNIGPKASGQIQNTSTFRATTEVPVNFSAGSRFRILTGSQAGLYTAQTVIRGLTGYTDITVSPSFPANPNLYGNKYFDIVFETRWDTDASTYRLVVDTESATAQALVIGDITGTITSITEPPRLPLPATTSFLLSAQDDGQVFWGSLSRATSSTSIWSFLRYQITPKETIARGKRLTIDSQMSVLPENETLGTDWFLSQMFGYSEIDTGVLRLEKFSSSPSLDYTYGYSRLEPFFRPDTSLDFRAVLRVGQGVLGAGDSAVVLKDTQREARLGTLLYVESVHLTLPFRRLIQLPHVSMAGLQDPEDQGWTGTLATTTNSLAREPYWVTQQNSSLDVVYQKDLTLTGLDYTDSGGRYINARFAVKNYTTNATFDTGVLLGADFGLSPNYRSVFLTLCAGPVPGVRVISPWVTLWQYNFDWTDQEPHTYQLLLDETGGAVVVVLDGQVQIPSIPLPAPTAAANSLGYFGAVGKTSTGVVDSSLATEIEWHSASVSLYPPASALRTLGVWKGGDKQDIDSWEIPRTDSSNAPNSAQVGPALFPMDWTSDIEIRMLHDPTWGISVYRRDLPLPPYYQPENPLIPGSGFATEITEPSAAWINVEYANLPRVASTFGSVAFGALEQTGVTQQHWDWVTYRLYKNPIEDDIAPQHMVLNWANVITSGEINKDITLESVVVPITSDTTVSLIPTHLFASYIYHVIDPAPGGDLTYTSDKLQFDPSTQIITLSPTTQGVPVTFSGAPVTITFDPGKPVTNTYLLNQPLDDSITILNEGTPPVPRGQTAEFDKIVVYGPPPGNSRLQSTDAPLNVLSDPYRVSSFQDTTEGYHGTAGALTVGGAVELAVSASSTDNYYLGWLIVIEVGNPSSGLRQKVVAYNGTTKVATVADPTWGGGPVPAVSEPYFIYNPHALPSSLYASMTFYEIPSEGETGLISALCDNPVSGSDSGWSTAGGDSIYSPTGGGPSLGGTGPSAGLFETGSTVGSPFGGFVLDFSGGLYTEQGIGPKAGYTLPLAVGVTGTPLTASGGAFEGSVLSPANGIVGVLHPVAFTNAGAGQGGAVHMVMIDTAPPSVTEYYYNE